MIAITKFVEADFSFVTKVKKYDGKFDWVKASYSFAESIYVHQKCSEEGEAITDQWEGMTQYGACKLEGDVIMFIDNRVGWTRDVLATEKYQHFLAEKELLK